MENRRAYYRLLLANFAAAFYNLAAQWMTQILVTEHFGLWRLTIGQFLPSLIALIASILLFRKKPRGVSLELLKGSLGVQLSIWILIGIFRRRVLPVPVMWLDLILALSYAIMAWRIMVQSREASANIPKTPQAQLRAR